MRHRRLRDVQSRLGPRRPAQRPAFSPARDDISYLGALTANRAWLYDQLAANTSAVLIVVLGVVGLWQALSPSRHGRLGAAALSATGVGMFLDGLFRLDCQSIDAACSNDDWHSHAHTIESGPTVGATFLAILLLGLAFPRLPAWHDAWLPTIAAIPAILVANLAFFPLGAGAAKRRQRGRAGNGRLHRVSAGGARRTGLTGALAGVVGGDSPSAGPNPLLRSLNAARIRG